jgi:energy-coupling factor transport system ATP-binding protein
MARLLEVDKLTYIYPGQGSDSTAAIDNISMAIEEGEFVAMIGANGSGKTTLARHFNALLLPSSGRVLVNGFDTRDAGHKNTVRNVVGMVFQNPVDQIIASTVEQDVAFGPENMGLQPVEIHRRVEEALRATNLWEQRLRPPHLLSAGQMQRLALAGVLALRPRCIVFDEASSMLDPAGRKDVMKIIGQLRQEGVTIIYITHFMEEAACADRIVVLHQGQIMFDGAPAVVFSQSSTLRELGLDLPPAAIVANMIREHIPQIPPGVLSVVDIVKSIPDFPKRQIPSALGSIVSEERLKLSDGIIEVSKLGYVYLQGTPLAQRALDGFSLSVGEHAVHGLLGATGSGKSTLLQHLNALLRPQEGLVRVNSYILNDRDLDVKSLRKTVGLVFQSPDMQLFEKYVGNEIAYGPRIMYGKEMLRERVQWAMEIVGLDYEKYKDRLTYTLSGGERRKVALASTLALQPKILLLDEPFAGLDPLTRRILLGRFRDIWSSGITLLFSSHNMEDAAALAGRLTLCNRGRDVLSGSVADVFTKSELLQDLGLELPIVAQVVEGFRTRGWPISMTITDAAVLVEVLVKILGVVKDE